MKWSYILALFTGIITNGYFYKLFEKNDYQAFLGLFLNPVLVFVFIEPIPYRLLFGGLGEYKILNGQYYGSSQIYEMNEQGVFNRASAGDEHYLVLCGENIALVYNRKMFEYKENV